MARRTYFDKLARAQKRNRSMLCIGLDPDIERLPRPFKRKSAAALARFTRAIVEATADVAAAYKPNWAFFEALGLGGMLALEGALEAVPSHIPVIADAKRGDIGNTARAYARAVFRVWNADAVTVNPYMGMDTLEPFLEYGDRGVYALCLTSNPGAADFEIPGRLYLKVARRLAESGHQNLGLVVGATQSSRIASVRKAAPELPFLLPGVGAQGGSPEGTVRRAWCERPGALLVNASRSILYASSGKDFAEAAHAEAERLRQTLERARPLA